MENSKKYLRIVIMILSFSCFLASSVSCLMMVLQNRDLRGNVSTGVAKCASDFSDGSFKVTNTGTVDLFCRVKVSKDDKKVDKVVYNLDDWKPYQGYYYYTKVLAVGDTSEPLIKSISCFSGTAEKDCVIVKVEVVQASDVGLDYFNIKAKDIGYDDKDVFTSSAVISLNNDTFSCNTDAKNVFKNFESIKYGDSKSQIIIVKNLSSTKKDIYLSAYDIKDKDKDIRVDVYVNGSSVYSGDLSVLHNISLGDFDANESKEVMIKISSNLGNNTAKEGTTNLKWGISTVCSSDDEAITPIKTNIDFITAIVACGLAMWSCLIFVKVYSKYSTDKGSEE